MYIVPALCVESTWHLIRLYISTLSDWFKSHPVKSKTQTTFRVSTLQLFWVLIGSLYFSGALWLARSGDHLRFPLLQHSTESWFISLWFCWQEDALLRLRIVEIVDLPGSQENNVKTKDVALTTPYLALNGALLHKVCLSLSSLIQRMHIVTTVDRETVTKDLKQWRPPRGQRFVKSETILPRISQ